MAKIVPFKGMRYSNKVSIGDVVAPPYDIIPPNQQDNLYNRSEYNVIRLEYGKEQNGDNDSVNKYSRAGEFLNEWINDGILAVEDKPAIYVYELGFTLPNGDKKALRGIVCRVKLEEFSAGVILPHEETLSKAKTDRFNLMTATDCNFSQIYSLYIDPERKIPTAVNEAVIGEPQISFTTDEGVVQRLWIITDEAAVKKICGGFDGKQLFIADGHHRYETALNFHKANPTDENGYVMMYLVDMDNDGLAVFPTHRMVAGLDFNEDELVEKLGGNFDVQKLSINENMEKAIENDVTTFALYTGKDYFYKIVLNNPSIMVDTMPNKSAASQGLDVSVLHTLVLDRILGIDMENMANQKNLTYTKILSEAIDEVNNGNQQCSFILNPTKVYEIKDVSIAGEKMPQKSTYFWPKLVTGIVMNKMEG